ncbi:MAG TPA: hypothetical protein V6D23_11455 [Candidatus Obscuribacterales bacterium]
MSDSKRDSFRRILEQIASLARMHPDYRFEYIQNYASQLGSQSDQAWIDELDAQWQELPAPRQEACLQLFDYALLQARQATYRPVNPLDAFLERQLFGIEDEEAVQKGTVSQALRQFEERKRPAAAPGSATGPATPPPASPPAGRTPAAGRTNPLNPRQIPKEEKG